MGLIIYGIAAIVTFFVFLFVGIKLFGTISPEDPEEFIPIMSVGFAVSAVWPLGLPVCILFGTGWFFIKYLSKDEE
jgi:hypothetical protein